MFWSGLRLHARRANVGAVIGFLVRFALKTQMYPLESQLQSQMQFKPSADRK